MKFNPLAWYSRIHTISYNSSSHMPPSINLIPIPKIHLIFFLPLLHLSLFPPLSHFHISKYNTLKLSYNSTVLVSLLHPVHFFPLVNFCRVYFYYDPYQPLSCISEQVPSSLLDYKLFGQVPLWFFSSASQGLAFLSMEPLKFFQNHKQSRKWREFTKVPVLWQLKKTSGRQLSICLLL